MILSRIPIAVVAAALLASCSAESSGNQLQDIGAMAQAETGATGSVQTINSPDAKALLNQQQDVVILDIRTTGEYNSGHLTDAVHLDYYSSDFPDELRKLDLAKPYLVYCAVGGRSRDAVRLMQQLGFKQVYDATEGFNGLRRAGVPVE